MKNPALALFWHSWRLSRRWYLLMLAIALAIHFTVMNLVPERMGQLPDLREHLAPGAVIFGFVLALFTTLLAISLGGRTGFPLRFEYRLPASTALLVGVPMATLALLCASLYGIPLLLGRLLYGLPMPLLAGMALIASTAMLLAAGSWLVSSTTARAMLLLVALGIGGALLAWLRPIRAPGGTRLGERVFDPDMISLSAAGYLVLLLLCLGLYALVVRGVGLQRQGEGWQRPRLHIRGASSTGASSRASMTDWTTGLLRLPCPVGRPWLAQLWFEFKIHGMPVLALGIALALLIPLFPLADALAARPLAGMLATMAPLALFFTGIGMAFFNRRATSGGYMNAFEATRGLGTVQLAGVQFGALGLALVIALALMAASLWLSASRFESTGPLWTRAAGLLTAPAGADILYVPAAAMTVLTGVFGLMAFFFCVHSCSTFWGRKVMYLTLLFLFYCVIFTFSVLSSSAVSAGLFVIRNMWGIALLTAGLTMLLLARVLVLRLFSIRSGALCLLGWLVAAAAGWVVLGGRGIVLASLPDELKALVAAGLLMPGTLLLGTIWCYSGLRHR